MTKVINIIGIRPEAIKMAAISKTFSQCKEIFNTYAKSRYAS